MKYFSNFGLFDHIRELVLNVGFNFGVHLEPERVDCAQHLSEFRKFFTKKKMGTIRGGGVGKKGMN